ncbi:MAG: aspartate kinase [Dehalococcoidia bacterium]|nr:aspartate kinase [Dehalococcoidia bacterium]
MGLVVQKYGGTSVANVDLIKNVARRIIRTKEKGNQVVAVVSAMGDTTDELVQLTRQITPRPDPREMDLLLSTGEIISCTLLSMALKAAGHEAVSLSGAQAGIQTDAAHTDARIVAMNPGRIWRELQEGRIVVVAGFQGVTESMDVTTLGRGGSDTTAVALAAALCADLCERYTDVDGVYTADPRICPDARKLKDISFEEMMELAVQGAKIMHPRAVEMGALHHIPIIVASSFNDAPGTLIHDEVTMELRSKLRGISHDTDVAKITVVGVPDKPGIAAGIFEPLAQKRVSVDTIVQNTGVHKLTDLTFTVARKDLEKAMEVIKPVVKSIGARECVADSTLGKVSIVGTGMQTAPGYAAKMFRTLSDKGINIELITTSEIRITCIISEKQVAEAVQALHQAFHLERVA